MWLRSCWAAKSLRRYMSSPSLYIEVHQRGASGSIEVASVALRGACESVPPPSTPKLVHLPSIHPGLYLGNHLAAKREDAVLNVPRVQGRVLNILDVTHKGFEEPALRKTRFGANVLYAPFRDEEDTDVGEFILWLNSASWVLHQALPDNDSRVLLHCYQGENRSAALAVAYACKYLQMGFADAVSAVRGPHWAPERVLNNASFEDNLKVWAQITAQPPAAHARPPAAGQPRLQHRVTSRFLAYRVLRPDEVPRLPLEGITARDPASGVSLQQHLDRGSDPAFFASAFISTTADVLIACRFAVPFQRIAVIDLKHFAASGGEHYDLTTDGSRMVALHSSESGSFTTEQARLFCTRSAEILLRPGALKRLPQDCVELLEIKVTTVGREVLPGSAPAEGLPDGFPASLELLQPVAAAEEPDSSSSPSSSSADANTGFVVVELALGPGAASSAAAPRLRFTAKRGRPNVDPRQMAPLSEMSRQLQNEFAAMKMARALGLPVLDCALYTFQFTFSSGAAGGQPAWEQLRADGNNPRDDVRTAHCLVFAGDVPKLRADTLKLLAAPGGAAAAADFAQQLRADFVRDSLLGNWFVCGTARTPNVVCGPDGRLVRVDLERCLGNRYHEDGRHSVKSRSVPFGDEVLELLELRALPPHAEPPSLQHAYAEAVAALSDDDVRAQIADVLLSRPALLEAAAASSGVAGVSASSGAHPSSTHLVTAIENRLSYLSTVARDRSLRPGAQLLPSRVSVRLPAVSGPVARDGHSATPLPWASGSSLIFGGHGQDDVYLGDFWVHNTETSRWRQLQLDAPSGDAAASPTCSSGGSAPVTPRHSHTAVAGSNFVVVYGGLGGIAGGAFADEVVVLDVGHEGKLSRLRVVNPSGLAPPRRGRHSASLVTVPGSGGAGQKLKMFVYGGYGDAAGQGIHCRLRDFWVCDIAIDAGAEEATLEWKKIDVPKQKQPPAMHRHFSCVHDGRLYILGGAWAGGFDTLWSCDLSAPSEGFARRATMKAKEAGPEGQSGHAFVYSESDGKVFCIGGGSLAHVAHNKGPTAAAGTKGPPVAAPKSQQNFGTGHATSVQTFERISVLDLRTATWSVLKIELPPGGRQGGYSESISSCTSPAACLTEQGHLFVMGGQSKRGVRRQDAYLLRSRA